MWKSVESKIKSRIEVKLKGFGAAEDAIEPEEREKEKKEKVGWKIFGLILQKREELQPRSFLRMNIQTL